MKRNAYSFFARLALRLHNLSYNLSSKFAVRAEDGLHPKHRLMKYHDFFKDNINNGDSVLDIGCGNGSLAFDLAKKAEKVVAIDIIHQNINIARKKYSADNIEYLIGDATSCNFTQTFDSVILSNVLEHINNRVEFLNKIKTLASKILIRVPMINRNWITLYKKESGVEWRSDPSHYTEYTIESLQNELEKAGLKLEHYSIQFGEIWGTAVKKERV